jgi:diguanylate cyclase (GGDEF)-like protein
MVKADVPVALVALPLALVLALTWVTAGPFAFLLLAGLVLVVSHTMKQMVESRRKLNQRLDELETLNVVGEAICSTPSVEDLVRLVHDECRKILDFTFFDVVLAEEEGSGYRTVYSAEEQGRETSYRRAPAERLAELASARGEAVVVSTRRELQFLLGGSGGADLRVETSSAACVPMLESDKMLGALCIQHHLAGRYTGEDLRALATISYQASVALQNLRLYQSATRDPLTGLFLRPVLLKRLEEELLRARTRGAPVQVMVLDLDHLKQINDTFGHAAGDIALRQVADAVRSSVRGNDVAARFGGDEFVVLLPGVTPEDCLRIATRLQERLRALTFSAGAEGEAASITVSIGLAGFDPEDRFDPAALLADADRALYRAKEKGRNRAVHARDLDEDGPASGTLHLFAPPA